MCLSFWIVGETPKGRPKTMVIFSSTLNHNLIEVAKFVQSLLRYVGRVGLDCLEARGFRERVLLFRCRCVKWRADH